MPNWATLLDGYLLDGFVYLAWRFSNWLSAMFFGTTAVWSSFHVAFDQKHKYTVQSGYSYTNIQFY